MMPPHPTQAAHRRLTSSGWLFMVVMMVSVVMAIAAFVVLDRRQARPPVVSIDSQVLQAHQSLVHGTTLFAEALELPPGDPRVALFRQAQGFFATARDAYRDLAMRHPEDASMALHEQESKNFLAKCRNYQVFIGQ